MLAQIDGHTAHDVPAIIMDIPDNMAAWRPAIHDVVHGFGDIMLPGGCGSSRSSEPGVCGFVTSQKGNRLGLCAAAIFNSWRLP